ncbi:MAG: ATP-dependent helicase HrpB [Candidatus Kapaibacterium sp.]
MTDFPIEHILPRLRETLAAGNGAVLQAPPGAGKTTRVPLALLDEPWLRGGKIIMLEPRRLAARAAARYMATMLGERAGDRVGYRMRMDTAVGPATRIEVVTEGVLTRMLQSDPALEGTGCVIFDEFHERSLQADLGLALALQCRSLLRDDLRILVMSATLDGAPVARLLGNAPVLTSEGRSYPVETRYQERRSDERPDRLVAAAVRESLASDTGDILVFLPGAGEIRRVGSLLEEMDPGPNVTVAPLYGNLPQEAQDRAIEPSPAGRRKVVLSTSIAETSLTIEGIRVVIDCGLMRVPRFSPRSGMTRLETVRVSRASADQRRGRAGRLGPGVCYRLWTVQDHEHLLPFGTPEIMEADLAPLALDLAEWGVANPAELAWLDLPPVAAFAQARELLAELGAVGGDGVITPHGGKMARLAFHPRLAHMVIRGMSLGLGDIACRIAALLNERDILRAPSGAADPDIRLRLEALRDIERRNQSGAAHGHQIDSGIARRVLADARHWMRALSIRDTEGDIESAGLLLGFAYPDRIGMARAGNPGRFLLRNGISASLRDSGALSGAEYLVAADLDGDRRESRIFLAAPIAKPDIEEQFGDDIETVDLIAWDKSVGGVRARRERRLGALLLEDVPLRNPDPEMVAGALLDAIAAEGLSLLPWSAAAARTRERLIFLHHRDSSWPDLSDEALLAGLEEWLRPHLHGIRRRAELEGLDLAEIIMGMLPWDRRAALDELAPTHITVPSGSRIPIDYTDPDAPALAVRLQEVFGMTETPRIARGVVPITMHLLSPAHRPVQVTRDLASFWRSTYFDVKKDLKGRYPKHSWPDDPLAAVPTNRARPRR